MAPSHPMSLVRDTLMYRLRLRIGQENGQVIDIEVYDYQAHDDYHDLSMQAKIHDENDKNFIDIAHANTTHRQSHLCGEDLKEVKGPDGHKYDASEYVELTWWVSSNGKKTYTTKFYITQIPAAAGYGVVLGNDAANALRTWQKSTQSHPVHTIALKNQTPGLTRSRSFKRRLTCQWATGEQAEQARKKSEIEPGRQEKARELAEQKRRQREKQERLEQERLDQERLDQERLEQEGDGKGKTAVR
jgi:hypothetical protein